jgi:hypothetical protein
VSSRQLAYVQKRRSTRIYNAIPLAIQGSDAFRAPYLEQVSTLSVSCHGCRYRSKYEVIPGDTVYLDVKQSSDGNATYSCQARVKWAQRLMTKDSDFDIAVELLSPGNIWGILSPPDDWFAIQAPNVIERENARKEEPLTARIAQQVTPILKKESARATQLERNDSIAGMSPSLNQLMAGFGNQIQIMVSQAATAAFVKERERLLAEFRTQLQNEAVQTLESLISTSKEELTRRMLKDLNDAHETAARISYENWNKKIEQDTKIAAQTMVNQAVEISRRVEAITTSAVKLLERNMEASRTEAADRFLCSLREQLVPLLEDAQVTLRNLKASEDKLKVESQAIRERFEEYLEQATQKSIAAVQEKTVGMLDQFESDVVKKLAESHDSLQERSIEVIAETTKILREISPDREESIEGQLRSLVSSATDDVAKALKENRADSVSILEPARK